MHVRRLIGALGRALIALGVLILLFVGYQLWGTGLAEQRNQKELRKQLTRAISAPPAPSPEQPGAAPTLPPTPEGEAVASMRIPDIGLDKAVVEGVSVKDLQKGPGHYPTTPMPGQPGNAAIAGHRTTYGAPFYRLDELEPGDQIFVTTRQGKFEYVVDRLLTVPPSASEVLDDTPGENHLTLTTCHPRFSAAQRLIVQSTLKGEAVEPPPPPPGTEPETPSRPTEIDAGEEEEEAGLSGQATAKRPAIGWGIVCAMVWIAAWALGQAWKKVPAYALGVPVFLVALFLFFENFARLLPANI